MKCKICGDPIFNRYANRWFHSWTHDHWAVREDQQTKNCSECGDIVHYNDNKWWHIHDRRNGKFCSVRDGTEKEYFTPIQQKSTYSSKIICDDEEDLPKNTIKNSPEEQMREQKCNEIKLYIEQLKLHKSDDLNQINQYEGWLHWWTFSSIENIIKEKGNYKLWCTNVCTPTQEQIFKEASKMINKDDEIKTDFVKDFDTIKQIENKSPFINNLTGKSRAIYLRNKHQKLVVDAYNKVLDIKNIIEFKDKNLKIKEAEANSTKDSIKEIKSILNDSRKNFFQETKSSKDDILTVLEKSSKSELEMFKEDIKTAQVSPTNITVKDKVKGTFVDEINHDVLATIPEQKFRPSYPERSLDEGAKIAFTNIKTERELTIAEREKFKTEAENQLNNYYKILNDFKIIRQDFVFNLIDAKNRIKFYHQKVNEGNNVLCNCSYSNSFFKKFDNPETQEILTKIDTDSHKIENFEEQIDKMLNIYQNVEIDESHKDIEY